MSEYLTPRQRRLKNKSSTTSTTGEYLTPRQRRLKKQATATPQPTPKPITKADPQKSGFTFGDMVKPLVNTGKGFLELISRPQNAVATGLKESGINEESRPLRALETVVSAKKQKRKLTGKEKLGLLMAGKDALINTVTTGNPLIKSMPLNKLGKFTEGFTKGLTGQKHTSGLQALLPEKEVEMVKDNPVSGLAADLLTDPLTFLPGGVGAKTSTLTKAEKAMREAAGIGMNVLKKGKKTLPAVSNAAKVVKSVNTAKSEPLTQVKYTTLRQPKNVKPAGEPLTQVKYSTMREPKAGTPVETTISKVSAVKPLPEMYDNYRKPLKKYADTLYHETSLDSSLPFIDRNYMTDMERDIYLSNNKNLALGQGDNKGVLIEFAPNENLNGFVNKSKPTWEMSYANNDAEFIARGNRQLDYLESVKSVSVKPGAQGNKVTRIRLKRVFEDWGKVNNSDGSVTYIKPFEQPQKGIVPQKGSQQIGEGIPSVKTILPKGKTIYTSNQVGPGAAKVSVIKPMKGSEAKVKDVIDDLVKDSDTWKDKNTVLLNRETLERNFEDMAGKSSGKLKSVITDSVKFNESERTRFLNKEREDLSKLDIKPRSKESEMLQKYGEGFYIDPTGKKIEYTLFDLKKDLPQTWGKVVSAERVIRGKYNTYIDTINKALTRNGYDPIPKRQDYFMHFHEIPDKLEMFGIPNNKLPTDINGITDDFLPGKNFFTGALQRKGPRTSYDALQGIDRYLEGASKLMYHTDDIQTLRAFEDALRDKHAGSEHLSNFVANLREYTNNLSGKKSRSARGMEADIGRGSYRIVEALKRQVGSNAVGANISSALTNFIPLTQSMATTRKDAFAQGMLETIANTFKNDGFINKSHFLTRRFGSDPLNVKLWTDRTDLSTGQKLAGNLGAVYSKTRNAGSWIFKVVDNFTSQTIVRSKYLEGLKKGLNPDAALKQADEWASRIMADRSLGSMPNYFTGKGWTSALTQFQLEVNNQLSFIFKDIPRNSPNAAAAASSIAQVFIYGYVFNELFEKVTGRRPAFDPIGVVQKAYEDYTNPELRKSEATAKLIDNIKNQLPYAGALTGGRIPITNAVPEIEALLTGKAKLGKELIDTATSLALPTGGGQIRKTVEGLTAMGKNPLSPQLLSGSYKKSEEGPQLKYPIANNPQNLARASLFGQYSVPEAREYFANTMTPLSVKQTKVVEEAAKKGIDPKTSYELLLDLRKLTKKSDEIKAINKKSELTSKQKLLFKKLIYSKGK
jgi:hypothetical protein